MVNTRLRFATPPAEWVPTLQIIQLAGDGNGLLTAQYVAFFQVCIRVRSEALTEIVLHIPGFIRPRLSINT